MQPRDDLDEMGLVLGRDEPVPDEELDHDCKHSRLQSARAHQAVEKGKGEAKRTDSTIRLELARAHMSQYFLKRHELLP